VEILAGLDYDFDIPYILGAGIFYDEWLKNGVNYTIINPGSTNWTAIGAPNNNAGTTFTKSGNVGPSIAGGGFAKVTGTAYSGIKISSVINNYQVRIQAGKSVGNTGYGIENDGGVVYFDGTMDLSSNLLGRTKGSVWTTLDRLTLNDDNFYLTMNSGNPLIAVSSSSTVAYNRATDQLNFTVATVGAMTLAKNYVQTFKPLIITTTTVASSTITGALQVSGGAGIGGNLYVGGSLYVNGVLTSGSGGGASTFTQTNFQGQAVTGSTVRTVDAKLKEIYVTPEDFGAVGNGITNDTAAIQAAIDTGKSVYLPDGKLYYITASSTAFETVIPGVAGVGLRITTTNQRFGGPGMIYAVGNIEAVKVTGGCSGVELDLTF
jgi:hypothetical protein